MTPTCDNTHPTERAPLTERTESEHEHDDDGDQPSVSSDDVSARADINTTCMEKHGEVLSPSSRGNAVIESVSGSTVVYISVSGSVLHCSPDSGVYSKAVSASLITSPSTFTESLDITSDLLKSSDNGASGLSISAAYDTPLDGSPGNNLQPQVSGETPQACDEVVQSNVVDDDDQNTTVDVRSSIMSAGTDDESNQTIVGTDELTLGGSVHSTVVPGHVKREDGQSEVDNMRLEADQHIPGLGSQEPLGLSDSDAEDDAVLKTVVAVRTKAADRVDSMKLFQPNEISDSVLLETNSGSVESSPGETCDGAVEQVLHSDLNVGSCQTECITLQAVNTDNRVVDSLPTEDDITDIADSHVATDLLVDGNLVALAAETCPITTEQLSTLTTELNQYVDTSSDWQTFDVINSSCQPLDLKATANLLSVDGYLAFDDTSRRPHARTRSFTSSNHSPPLSRSCSPEPTADSESEMRRHSCTSGTPPPSDTAERLDDLSLEQHGCGVLRDHKNVPQVGLTASMEDLKLRPSRKRLEFDSLPAVSSQPLVLEPPDEYRDRPVPIDSTRSYISPDVTDFSTDAPQQFVDLNMQAKSDHLQRYLKSLAAMPGYDSVYDVLDSGSVQDADTRSEDVSHGCRFDEADGIEIRCQERSASLLMPSLLHQSDNVEELAENECLELQLQHYEVMKQRLMAEHRRSLEHLLAEQERQMSLLQTSLLGQTLSSDRSLHTGTMAHTSSTLATDASDHRTGKPQPSYVPDTFGNESNEMHVLSHSEACKDQHNSLGPEQRVNTSVDDASSIGHKAPSTAGVFYSDRQVVSREPSCSTIRSDDTESEFAYKSPAVLRNIRRLTPSCSPRDTSEGQSPTHHGLMPTLDGYPAHCCNGLDRSHRGPDRRFVDMFSEASLYIFKFNTWIFYCSLFQHTLCLSCVFMLLVLLLCVPVLLFCISALGEKIYCMCLVAPCGLLGCKN